MVPREIIADLRGTKQKEAAIKANDILLEKARGLSVSIDAEVEQAMPQITSGGKDFPMLRVQNTRFRRGTVPFVVVNFVGLEAAEGSKAAKLRKGARIKLEGKVMSAIISASPSTASLQVQLTEAKLKD